jgi:hypothetical protein
MRAVRVPRPPVPTIHPTLIEYRVRWSGTSVSPLRARVLPHTLHYIAYSAHEIPSASYQTLYHTTHPHANVVHSTRDPPPTHHSSSLHTHTLTPMSPSPSLLIQAGHSAAYPPHLPGGGGAAGEADWTAQLAARIADYLKASPAPPHQLPTVTIVGSWAYYLPGPTPGAPSVIHIAPPPPEALQDYTLFISLHYNGSTAPNTSGCNAGRALNDPAHAKADEFIALWRQIYPELTGIPLDPTVPISPNVQYYYAFADTSPSTPGTLIEHGYGPLGQGDHDILYNDIDLIAQADVSAICAFLKIAPPTFTASTPDSALPVQPQPTPPAAPPASDLSVYAEALRLANWQKHEFEAYIRDYPPGHRQSVDDAAALEGAAPITLMLRWAQDHFTQGETAP